MQLFCLLTGTQGSLLQCPSSRIRSTNKFFLHQTRLTHFLINVSPLIYFFLFTLAPRWPRIFLPMLPLLLSLTGVWSLDPKRFLLLRSLPWDDYKYCFIQPGPKGGTGQQAYISWCCNVNCRRHRVSNKILTQSFTRSHCVIVCIDNLLKYIYEFEKKIFEWHQTLRNWTNIKKQ